MGTFIGSLTNAASITLTDSTITKSFCIHTMPLTHTDISSTAATIVANFKLFSISFCNICGLSSNLNSVHQYLQSSNLHALFLTETKIKPLAPNDNSFLCARLKCPGYELFSSFFPNDGVCAYVRSDVESSRLPQFDLVNPGFQLIWMKISLSHTSNSFGPYTAHLTQLTMKFYLTIYLKQLTQLLFNLHALKSQSLVISMSTIRTGLPTLHISLALLVVMQRPLPL